MIKTINTSRGLHGEIVVPGDKSISHRAVMIGGIAHGVTRIKGFLKAADPLSTLSCYQTMGIRTESKNDELLIYGKGIHGLQKPSAELNAGNSGTTIRLLSGILSGQKFESTISGDPFLVQRPMKRIIDPLKKMGAQINATEKFTAPLHIVPVDTLHAIDYELPIASAQVKSAVLLAGLYADGITKVIEHEESRDHTERMLQLHTEHKNGNKIISITGGRKLEAGDFEVPGDASSSAFFIVGTLITPHSEILIRNVGLNPTRTGFIKILQSMGASISVVNERNIGGEPIGDLAVTTSSLHSDIVVNGTIIPNIIDEIPILAVAALFAKGRFEIRNAQDLRNKETDRIKALCVNIRKLGIEIEEYHDGFAFESKNDLFPAVFNSFDDHRIAMAFGIASLNLPGISSIQNAECVSISYPKFWETLESLQH
ncbi:MAG: 3-phosphoshikimate 1-carboxyvinyltransferase [Bacteroidota bacterium]